MSYKFQKGDAKLGGAVDAQALSGSLAASSLSSLDTDDLSEGSTNLYYADSLARAAVSVTDAGGDGSMAYDSGTGVFTYTGPSASEVRAHLTAGDGLDVASGEFSLDLKSDGGLDIQSTELSIADLGVTNAMLSGGIASGKLAELNAFDTDALSEGSSNQYFTSERARKSVSVVDAGGDGSLTYVSGTGVFTYTGPSAAEVRAHLTAGAGLDVADGEFSLDLKSGGGLDIQSTELSIADLGVTNAMLAADAVDGNKLADDSVDSEHIVDGAVDNVHLANSTISGIALGGTLGALSTGNGLSMTSFDGSAAVSDLTIDLDGATLSVGVSGLKVADGGVDTTQLAADAVEGSKIADDAVDSEHIAAGAIDFEHFAANSVSGSALANNGVGSAKIAELDNFDTDDLSEGSSNLYYTDARARAAVSVTDAGGDGSMAYNSSTGVLTYTGPSASEVRAHFSAGSAIGISSGEVAFTGSTDDVSEGSNLYFTDARARAAISGQDGLGYNSSTGVMSFTGSTDDVSEGSNLYYTDARARAAVSVTDAGGDGSMAYDNSTGVLTYTGPSASEVRAHFSAGDAIAISSGEISVDSSIAGHGLNVSSGVLSAQHSVKSIGITNATASYGMNFQSGGTISSTVSVRLPAIVSGTVGVAGDLGKVVMVKAAELSGSGKVTVACAGSSTIDGPTDTSLDIESSAGAVTLMVVSQDGNGIWAII
jgi:hypothetical protein